ncbi:molybdenum cofactor guanylyltransferase [Lonsdalea populi]|uniref:Molybdenum cofactor guanylyltransferase n=1 Tax=Lonsdalea populi TaxID=1172565 RepID=A0A3N0U743_9GAMM|nr:MULTISPECIES: molybdenum cofactor guanylyltransferase MobA [Lonsdalea]OSM95259.1 molybdenum cofactor guanylyltransferase [Lonsdalea populi]OSN01429.1 molybdenum cofactor guanylyltransferase [Lonsdalea populi]QPQ25954.1 molybdenum cofactor guanylyltransferase MobA [Lonsdalea populi]RAT12794.1 molybdenum cofactor guanylyltransferase [Lonsdalea quercina]RAT25111.1 molybdenum cofactor guanylyltransferase [Lonsdalea populi]
MITGIILAGGQSSRMGGHDKGLLLLDGIPLYRHVLTRLASQVDNLLINTNRHHERYQQSGYPAIGDINRQFAGPLAGMYTGLTIMETEWALFAPCDMPALPLNLVSRLQQHIGLHPAAYATDGERDHPALLLINKSQTQALKAFLSKGDRKLMLFLKHIDAQPVSFSEQPQAFRNLNTPEELTEWREERKHD